MVDLSHSATIEAEWQKKKPLDKNNPLAREEKSSQGIKGVVTVPLYRD
jgi:hypothetical protein